MDLPLHMNGQIHYTLIRRKDELGEIDYYTWAADIEREVGWRILAKLSYGLGTVEEIGEQVYGNTEKYHSWAGTAKIILREGHVATVEYREGFYRNIYGGIYKKRSSTIEMHHDFRGRVTLAYGGYDIKDIYEEGIIEDDMQGGRASLELFFTDTVSVLVSGNYEKTSKEPEGWQGKYSGSKAAFTYHPTARFSSSLTYAYIENKSDEAEREYANNRYGLTIKITF